MTFTDVLNNVIGLARQNKIRELENFLMKLPVAEVYWIETIMYWGRDGNGFAGIFDLYAELIRDSIPITINNMTGKDPMPDYIEAGIRKLRKGGVDIDTLLTTHIDSPLASLNSSDGVVLTCGPWICDKCGKVIDQAKDGMVVWIHSRNDGAKSVYRDIQIVHHKSRSPLAGRYGCYPDEKKERERNGSSVCMLHLHHMVGTDWLITLLSFVEDNNLSFRDASRIIMRICVPGYEQAIPYFGNALQTGVVEQSLPDDYFLQSDLRMIVANISKLSAHENS